MPGLSHNNPNLLLTDFPSLPCSCGQPSDRGWPTGLTKNLLGALGKAFGLGCKEQRQHVRLLLLPDLILMQRLHSSSHPVTIEVESQRMEDGLMICCYPKPKMYEITTDAITVHQLCGQALGPRLTYSRYFI